MKKSCFPLSSSLLGVLFISAQFFLSQPIYAEPHGKLIVFIAGRLKYYII